MRNVIIMIAVCAIISAIMPLSLGSEDAKTQSVGGQLGTPGGITIQTPTAIPASDWVLSRGGTSTYDKDTSEDIIINDPGAQPFNFALYVKDYTGNSGKMRTASGTSLQNPMQVGYYSGGSAGSYISLSNSRQRIGGTWSISSATGKIDIALRQATGSSTSTEPDGTYSTTLEWYITTAV